jgi:hypothetical protein
LDKIFKANENGASFYEKLILFDVGTIGLSLTLLEQIIAHSPGAHVPRHPFLWFLCPAWFLLLISIHGCTRQIISFHNANNLLVSQTSALFAENYLRDVGVVLNRSPAVVMQIPLAQPQPETVGGVLKAAGEKLIQTANENTSEVNELIQQAVRANKGISIAAKISVFATTVALLICIFAIESALHI